MFRLSRRRTTSDALPWMMSCILWSAYRMLATYLYHYYSQILAEYYFNTSSLRIKWYKSRSHNNCATLLHVIAFAFSKVTTILWQGKGNNTFVEVLITIKRVFSMRQNKYSAVIIHCFSKSNKKCNIFFIVLLHITSIIKYY
jgi:hypothetical protein